MNFSSKLIEDAVAAFEQLPGIGKRTALRLVLYLLKQDPDVVDQFSSVISTMRKKIKFCKYCHNIADDEICSICSNPKRNISIICVVEDIREVISIENTNQYNGLYHVLGGIISPIDGIGPDQLNIESLINRLGANEVKEAIMALSPTIEGDTTIFYLSKRLKDLEIQITTVARGIAFGGEIEYADEFTLARSIVNRLPFESYLVNSNSKDPEN